MYNVKCIMVNGKRYLLQCEWIYNIYDQNVGGKDNDVHQQTDTHEIAETVTSRTIDQHVGRRADRSSKATTHTYHQGDEEGLWLVA